MAEYSGSVTIENKKIIKNSDDVFDLCCFLNQLLERGYSDIEIPTIILYNNSLVTECLEQDTLNDLAEECDKENLPERRDTEVVDLIDCDSEEETNSDEMTSSDEDEDEEGVNEEGSVS